MPDGGCKDTGLLGAVFMHPDIAVHFAGGVGFGLRKRNHSGIGLGNVVKLTLGSRPVLHPLHNLVLRSNNLHLKGVARSMPR